MEKKLLSDHLSYMKEMFTIVDMDHDGLISTGELIALIRLSGQRLGQNTSDAAVEGMVREIVANDCGKFNFSNFVQVIAPKTIIGIHSKADMSKIFGSVDKDHDGLITAAELKQIISEMGECRSDTEIIELVRMVDSDGKGQINFEKFVKIWKIKID